MILRGLRLHRKKITADVVDITEEPESEAEPKDVTELLQSYNKSLRDEELLLMDEQRQWFPELESTAGEDTMKIVEMTSKDLEYDIHLVDKAVAWFENNFETSSTVGEMMSNSTACCREIICERKSQFM